jgi:hypothetical protein
MNKKQIQNQLNKLLQKAKNKNRVCCVQGCEEPAINSHILQKNGILSGISTNGHIMTNESDFLKEELFFFKRAGINQTFTFKGFCKVHDKEIFKEIEDYEIDFEDYRTQLLFAYRTLLNEDTRKHVLIDWNNLRLHDPILEQTEDKSVLREEIRQYRLANKDSEYYLNKMIKDLESNTEQFEFRVRYIQKNEVCLSSHFTYETTREQAMFLKESGTEMELLTDVFVSMFPLEDETVFIMGYLKYNHEKCGNFVNHFFEIDEYELMSEISNLMLLRCEVWVCSENFYTSKLKPRESEINKIFRFGANNINEDMKLDINLFN